MILYFLFIFVNYNISYLYATIYIQAPNSVPSSQVQNLVLKFINPLRDIRGITNSKVEVEVVFSPPVPSESKNKLRSNLLSSQREDALGAEGIENMRDRVGKYRRDINDKTNEKESDNNDIIAIRRAGTENPKLIPRSSVGEGNAQEDSVVRMSELRKELLALEMRLSTGNRLVNMDDLKEALKELEKKHFEEDKNNKTKPCNEERLLEEALQPALLEDLWEALGQKFKNLTELACSFDKKTIKQKRSTTTEKMASDNFSENDNVHNEDLKPEIQNSDDNSSDKENKASENNDSYNENKEKGNYDIGANTGEPFARRSNDEIYDELLNLVDLLKKGANIEKLVPTDEDVEWMKIKIPANYKNLIIKNL